MSKEENSDTAADGLSRVAMRFAAWRNTPKRTRRIPEDLWQAAVDLTKDYSINKISNALRLSYSDFKKRVESECQDPLPAITPPPRMKFIELGVESHVSVPECMVEMENGSGGKLRIHLRGKNNLDLYELSRAFWSKTP
jgi:hypothetical protein